MYAMILAGGSGTRLWPLSRELFPKYHLSVLAGSNSSLLEHTVQRLGGVVSDDDIMVITNENQQTDIKTVMARNNKDSIRVLGEPCARNTAPAVGLAAWYWARKNPEEVMFVFPSDHYLQPENEFHELLRKAQKSAMEYGLVTFGIRPDAPETGYGYIFCGEALDDWTYRVNRFVEKPDLENAKKFLDDGRYLWNSGMFAFKVSVLQAEFRQHLPEMAAILDQIDYNDFHNLRELYEKIQSISIDYGIMEKSDKTSVIPTNINWNDIGSWNSWYQMNKHDENGNAIRGRVISVNSADSLMISTNRLVGAVGVKNLAIVDTEDAVLVCDRENSQDVKKIVEQLKEEKAEEASVHRTVYRPWGSYTVLTEGDGFKVKTITVNPKQRLSLQRHRQRAEHWVVVRGMARITVDENVYDRTPGQFVSIPKTSLHRLENIGDEQVEIIEVQNGSYLGEDDIERISDDYNRIEPGHGKTQAQEQGQGQAQAQEQNNGKGEMNSKKHDGYLYEYKRWVSSSLVDDDTRQELKDIAEDKDEVRNRFYRNLEFGTGGLRGVIGAGTNRINRYVVRRASQGIANYLKDTVGGKQELKVAIACDSRHFSPFFAEEAALVFAANGIKAYLFDGIRPTPLLSFAIRELQCDAGAVITASHNPARYNGYKVYTADGGQAVPAVTEKLTGYINDVDILDHVFTISKDDALKKNLLETISADIDRAYIEKVKELSTYQGSGNIKIVYTPLHGTGYRLIPTVLKELGYNNLYLVDEQAEPDPEFPTVKSPNPEDREAFEMGLKKAAQEEAHIALGTDPDGDRVGCAVRDKNGEYVLLNGNQMGALLINYLLSRWSEQQKLPENGVIVKTIVTGNMGRDIALKHGLQVEETLTGFKFIGELINRYEKAGDKKFLFGYEESYGYLAGTFVRDKDAVISAALLVEMAAFYHDQGRTLLEVMDELYQKYGYYYEELISIELPDPETAEKLMNNMSRMELKSIAGSDVVIREDYATGISQNMKTGETTSLQLPQTKSLLYKMADGSWFCVRPSGTEPKFKIYISATGEQANETSEKLENLKKDVQKLFKD